MGMCKSCGIVYNANEMIDGICEVCRNPKSKDEYLQKEQQKSEYLLSKKILTEYELKEIIGQTNNIFFRNELIDSIDYLYGLDELDTLIDEDKSSNNCFLSMHKKGLALKFISGFFKYIYIAVPSEKLITWTIEKADEIKEDKSVLGRALLGGVLLGPLGAVVGGISGVGEKKVSNIQANNILTLFCNVGGEDKVLLFAVPSKNFSTVYNWFMKNYRKNYRKPDDISFQNKTTTTDESPIKIENNISVADELKKLKELVNDDILTQEEFEIQKKKLLNM